MVGQKLGVAGRRPPPGRRAPPRSDAAVGAGGPTMRSRIQRWKPAGWSGPIPTYSSMWNTTSRARARRGCRVTSASTKASCELPVANMAWATPPCLHGGTQDRGGLVGRGTRHRGHVGDGRAPAPARTPWRWDGHIAQHARWASDRLEPMRAGRLPREVQSRPRVGGRAPAPRGDAGGAGPPARPERLAQARDVPADRLVQGARRPGGRGGDAGDEPGREVVAASAGNHGLGLAFAAAELGAKVTVVVPRLRLGRQGVGAPAVRCAAGPPRRGLQRGRGARARSGGREGGRYVSPYNDPDVIAGQGTLARELLEQVPNLGTVVVPVRWRRARWPESASGSPGPASGWSGSSRRRRRR